MIETQAGFFTQHPDYLDQELTSLLGQTQRSIDPAILVAPYGTLDNVGSMCGTLYGSLESQPQSIVFLGTHESDTSTIAYPSEDITTPIGDITIDSMFKQRLALDNDYTPDNTAFSISRSILPHIAFFHHLNPDIRLSPLLVSSDTAEGQLDQLVSFLSDFLTPEDLLVVSGRLGKERVRDPDATSKDLQRTDSGFITEMQQRHPHSIQSYGDEHAINIAPQLSVALRLRSSSYFQMMGHRTWIDNQQDLVGGCIGYYG